MYNAFSVKNTYAQESILFFLCTSAALTIWLPFREKSVFLLFAIIATAMFRKRLNIGKDIKITLLLFIAYLIIFTILSHDHSRSIKGVYDIIRGLLLFPIGILLGLLWKEQQRNHIYFLLIASTILLGNFLFPVSLGPFYYFGYSYKPNDISELFMGLIILSFLTIPTIKTNYALSFAWLIYLFSGLTLILLAESRGIWLALLSSLLLYVLIEKRFSIKARLTIFISSITVFLSFLIFYSHKGFGLRSREEIWNNVFKSTYEHSPYLGFGINHPAIPEINLQYNFAHNVLLEIYASSGIAGLLYLGFLLAYLLRHLYRIEFSRNSIYYTGIIGLTAYLLLSMINLRFSSFSFFASISLFFGLFYSQSKVTNEKIL